MTKKSSLPSAWSMGLFAWSAGMVFMTRGTQLLSDPNAGATLAGMAAEKQRAFANGAFAAGRAMMRGASPAHVQAAALAPARRAVRANFAKLGK
jgi:hypothetical protein